MVPFCLLTFSFDSTYDHVRYVHLTKCEISLEPKLENEIRRVIEQLRTVQIRSNDDIDFEALIRYYDQEGKDILFTIKRIVVGLEKMLVCNQQVDVKKIWELQANMA